MKDFYIDFFCKKNKKSLEKIEVLNEKKSFSYIKNYTYSLSQKIKDEKIDLNFYKFKVYFNKQIYKSYHESLILCFIDLEKVYNLIKNGKQIPNRKLFFNILQVHYFNKYKKNNNINFLDDIKPKKYDIKQWDDLNFSKYFNNIFYTFQKENILWMLDNECNNDIIIKNFGKNIYKLYKDLYVNMYYNRFIFYDEIEDINFRGGILYDEPGLGKSLCSLAISELNKKVDFESKLKLKSEATLIITSNEMSSHWMFLIKKFIKKQRNIIPLISKRDFDRYKYKDIINADYVIFSVNLITNKSFCDKIKQYHNSSNSFIELGNTINTIQIEMERNSNLLEEKNILPFIVYWKRIIFDKVVERCDIINYPKLINYLYSFKSFYRWIIEDNIKDIYSLKNTISLLIKNNFKSFNHNTFTLNNNLNLFLRKNLTKDIKNELQIKKIKKQFIPIQFNYLEKKIQEYFPSNFNNLFYCEYPNLKVLDSLFSFTIISQDDYLNNLNNDNYKNNLIEMFKENKFECNICYESYQSKNIRFYTCGHFNCIECIEKLLKKSKKIKCPNCRNMMFQKNIFNLYSSHNDTNNSKLDTLYNLISKTNNKIILLTYSDKYFNELKNKLSCLITVHSCKGSFFQKNFIMNRFNNSNEKSLLLCTYQSSETLQKINTNFVDIIYLSPLNLDDIFYKHKFLLLNNILQKNNSSHFYLYYQDSIEKKLIEKIKNKYNDNNLNINSLII